MQASRDHRECQGGRDRPQGWRRLAAESGLSIMEMIVTMGMITIIAGMAVPQFSLLSQQMNTMAAAQQVLADLNYARAMTLRTGVPHYVNVTGGTNIVYDVHRSAAPPAIDPSTDPVLRAIDLQANMNGAAVFSLAGAGADPYGGSVTVPTPAGQMVFTSRGMPQQPGSYFIADSGGKISYAISITGAGRIRIWQQNAGGWS